MGSSGYGHPSGRYLDPERVFAIVVSRRPQDLFEYLESVPGAHTDLQCRLVYFAGMALQAPRPRNSPPWLDNDSWALYWAKYAWAHALISRLCVPRTVSNGFNYPSDPVLRHAAILDHFSASSSSTPALMISPQQTSYDAVINFPIVRTQTTLDQTSTFNSGRQASDFAPWGADSTLELAFAKLSLGELGSEQMAPQELMQNNHGTPAMGVPSLRQHGSAQLTSQRLMQNGEVLRTFDIKGKRPASEIVEQKVRVHVASLIAEDGTTGAAGLLIKKGTWQFMCAACFPMQAMEQVIFAAACCEGIKIARAYQPTTIVLESHLFHLLNLLAGAHAPCPQMEELMKLLDPSRCTVEAITEEGNGAARQLAMHSLMTGVSEIFFSAPPDWLALT